MTTVPQCGKGTAKFGGLSTIWGPANFFFLGGGLATIWRGLCPPPPAQAWNRHWQESVQSVVSVRLNSVI